MFDNFQNVDNGEPSGKAKSGKKATTKNVLSFMTASKADP